MPSSIRTVFGICHDNDGPFARRTPPDRTNVTTTSILRNDRRSFIV